MPLHVIITAANTVSRARVAVSESLDTISVTISPTSMIVTATASTSDPKGSPTRWATTLGVVDRREHRAREEGARDDEAEGPGIDRPQGREGHNADEGDHGRPADRLQQVTTAGPATCGRGAGHGREGYLSAPRPQRRPCASGAWPAVAARRRRWEDPRPEPWRS
jgi:hypothetical protein